MLRVLWYLVHLGAALLCHVSFVHAGIFWPCGKLMEADRFMRIKHGLGRYREVKPIRVRGEFVNPGTGIEVNSDSALSVCSVSAT